VSKPPPSLQDEFSPALHFRAPFGWINDPNGLVFADGLWHLFYQFHPMSTVWGPMYWGHAVSEDLLQWKHMPVALAPDALGNIFSGSCVVDARNHSGLFPGPSGGNLLAFYTSALPQGDGQPDYQTQSIAYSVNGGATWQKWLGNPVIGNPGLGCFRDPKVFWFTPGGYWIMLLTHGQAVGIYRSTDLLRWDLASEFGDGQGHHSPGPWECPDLFELTTSTGESRWVLVVGVGDGCPAPGSGTQYFIGSFDGIRFVNESTPDHVRWLDLGRDHYATQSWFAAPQGRRVAIAWMSNWRYARNTSTRFFRGVMTLPRDLYMGTDSSGEHFVWQRFSEELNRAFATPPIDVCVGESQAAPATMRVRGHVRFRFGDTLRIRLFDDDHDQICIERAQYGYKVTLVRRVHTDDETLSLEFPHQYDVPLHLHGEVLDIDMIVDAGAVELLLDGGRYSITQLFFPRSVAGALRLEGSASGHLALFECAKELCDG
jgi:fructan beta-fructosidase